VTGATTLLVVSVTTKAERQVFRQRGLLSSSPPAEDKNQRPWWTAVRAVLRPRFQERVCIGDLATGSVVLVELSDGGQVWLSKRMLLKCAVCLDRMLDPRDSYQKSSTDFGGSTR
jgi:hypothetical protein